MQYHCLAQYLHPSSCIMPSFFEMWNWEFFLICLTYMPCVAYVVAIHVYWNQMPKIQLVSVFTSLMMIQQPFVFVFELPKIDLLLNCCSCSYSSVIQVDPATGSSTLISPRGPGLKIEFCLVRLAIQVMIDLKISTEFISTI